MLPPVLDDVQPDPLDDVQPDPLDPLPPDPPVIHPLPPQHGQVT